MSEGAYDADKSEYRSGVSRRISLLIVLALLLVIAVVGSCAVGTGYGFGYTFDIIVQHIQGETYPHRSEDWWADYYIVNNLFPQVAMAVIAGAGLALAGTVMQSVMENPLADAYTTGIASGAMLGAVTSIVMGFAFSTVSASLGIITNAFIGSMVPAALMVVMIRRIGTSPSTVILIGTALSFFFNSVVTLLMVTSGTEQIQDAYLWQIGSVAGAHWSDLPLMLTMVVAGSVLLQASYRNLNLMAQGERTAKSLGLNVSQFRMLCILLISLLVASIISYTGIIGFIGLVAPHIARFILGNDSRFVIPGSILMGSLVLVLADLVSRSLTDYATVPIGVVMSVIGAPVFLYLIVSRRSRREVFRWPASCWEEHPTTRTGTTASSAGRGPSSSSSRSSPSSSPYGPSPSGSTR